MPLSHSKELVICGMSNRQHDSALKLCIHPQMMYFPFFFTLCCRMLEYSLNLQSVSFSAVRTVRVLRPLRAINRVPSEFRPAGPLHLSPLKQTLHPRTLCSFISKRLGFLWRQITLLVVKVSQAAKDPHIV